MSRPDVAVVIPTHNRPQLLAHSVHSVLAQRGVEVEVVVVDDGSTPDEVPDVLPRDARIRLIRHSSPRGVSTARNAGVSASTAEWVAFLDDDDLVAPDALAAQLDQLRDNVEFRWSCVGVALVDDDLNVIGCARTPKERDISASILAASMLTTVSGIVVSRALFEQAGPFDRHLSCLADWDIHLRLAQLSPLASVDRPLLAYRVHSGAMSADVEACDEEFHFLCRRYQPLREARGVEVDRANWEHWKEAVYLRRGLRRRAIEAAYRSAGADGDWYRFARTVAVAVVPRAARVRSRRQLGRVPTAWRAEAESWLASMRPPSIGDRIRS